MGEGSSRDAHVRQAGVGARQLNRVRRRWLRPAAYNVGYVKLNLNLTVLLEIIKTALSSVPPAHALELSTGPRQRVSRAI
jgi:hypothetical protein